MSESRKSQKKRKGRKIRKGYLFCRRGMPKGVHTVDLNSDSRPSYITFCRSNLPVATVFVFQRTVYLMKLLFFDNRVLGVFLRFVFFGVFRDSDNLRGRESEFPPTEEKEVGNRSSLLQKKERGRESEFPPTEEIRTLHYIKGKLCLSAHSFHLYLKQM